MSDAPVPDDVSNVAEVLARLTALPPGAGVLVLGTTDTGKTTFLLSAARALVSAGRTAALVDTDLGQSEIGPPATVGAAAAEAEFTSLRSLPLLGAAFVGAVSPARHVPETLLAAHCMMESARARRPDVLLTDTDGWTGGPAAARFKRLLIETLRPTHVAALARAGELDPLLLSLPRSPKLTVWRVPPAPDAQKKAPATRATRRAARFLAALGERGDIMLSWDDAALVGTGLAKGETVPVHVQQFLSQSLKRPVLHAERGGGGLYVVINGDGFDPGGLPAIEAHFRGAGPVQVVPAQRFAGLLVGLLDGSGDLLNIGLISRVDFAARTLTVRTLCKRPAAVRAVVCGAVRLKPNGQERGDVRPGEL